MPHVEWNTDEVWMPRTWLAIAHLPNATQVRVVFEVVDAGVYGACTVYLVSARSFRGCMRPLEAFNTPHQR